MRPTNSVDVAALTFSETWLELVVELHVAKLLPYIPLYV